MEGVQGKKEIKNKREHWRGHSEAWQQSGQAQGEYCKQHGLNLKTFAYWRRRFKADSTPVKLVQLPSGVLQQQAGSALRVKVDSRYTIEVSDGFSPATLGCVLEVLKRL